MQAPRNVRTGQRFLVQAPFMSRFSVCGSSILPCGSPVGFARCASRKSREEEEDEEGQDRVKSGVEPGPGRDRELSVFAQSAVSQ